jgi:amphi-Trp domain-containing protein
MSDEVNLPNSDSERQTVTDGFFEREVYLSREETADFLRNLANQIESERQITVSSEKWEIPFEYESPIEVEVEFAEGHQTELEIEFEFTEPSDSDGIEVN